MAFAARLRDRFADHGLVAVVIGRIDGTALDIDTWLMSCRVIGRTLEQSLVEVLATQAAEHGCDQLRGRFIPTAKNALVKDLYADLGFAPDQDLADGTTTWFLPISGLCVSHHIAMPDSSPSTRS